MEPKHDDKSRKKSSCVQFSNASSVSSESDLRRPTSALARGVQITEYQDARNNPQPLRTDRSIRLLEGYLAPQKLRAITGIDDLETVNFLEMKVDSRETSLGNFGMHLPNLTQLKLSNSIIVSMRDLGSSLNNLQVLWMAQCGTEDLDGVSAMVNLQELYLSFNEISDISPCGMLENLQILDVEGNNISDISQLTFLVLCQKLSSLTLEGNPVCISPSPEEANAEYNYRRAVKKLIPHLVTLDEGLLVEDETAESNSGPSVFEEDWKLLDELMLECPMTTLDDDSPETGEQHFAENTAKPVTPYRPGSALKPHSAAGIRPTSGHGGRSAFLRTGAGSRPGSSNSHTGSGSHSILLDDDSDDGDPTCDLTTGGVICGNLSKALRGRRQKATDVSAKKAEKLFSQLNQNSEPCGDIPLEDDESIRQLKEELEQWKENHRKRVEEIEKSKAPQILRIEHDDDDVASSDAESNNGSDAEDQESLERMMNHGDFSDVNSEKLFTRNMHMMTAELRTGRLSHRTMDSGIGSLQSLQSTHQAQDESIDADDDDNLDSYEADFAMNRRSFSSGYPGLEERRKDGTTMGVLEPVPPSFARQFAEPSRPISGPVMATRRKFRLESNNFKTPMDPVDPARSDICEGEGFRAGTSPAALGKAQTIPSSVATSQLRRGLLSSIPLLPSKYNK